MSMLTPTQGLVSLNHTSRPLGTTVLFLKGYTQRSTPQKKKKKKKKKKSEFFLIGLYRTDTD
jgi:hypothetical protein